MIAQNAPPAVKSLALAPTIYRNANGQTSRLNVEILPFSFPFLSKDARKALRLLSMRLGLHKSEQSPSKRMTATSATKRLELSRGSASGRINGRVNHRVVWPVGDVFRGYAS